MNVESERRGEDVRALFAFSPVGRFRDVLALQRIQFRLRGDVVGNQAVYFIRIKRRGARG